MKFVEISTICRNSVLAETSFNRAMIEENVNLRRVSHVLARP